MRERERDQSRFDIGTAFLFLGVAVLISGLGACQKKEGGPAISAQSTETPENTPTITPQEVGTPTPQAITTLKVFVGPGPCDLDPQSVSPSHQAGDQAGWAPKPPSNGQIKIVFKEADFPVATNGLKYPPFQNMNHVGNTYEVPNPSSSGPLNPALQGNIPTTGLTYMYVPWLGGVQCTQPPLNGRIIINR